MVKFQMEIVILGEKMKQIINVEYEEEGNQKYYVYIDGNLVGKQYDMLGVIKQLLVHFWRK
jgi:hypothetical protein